MTVQNTTVTQNYTVVGGNDTYAIPFDFVAVDVIKVYVDNVLQTVGAGNDYQLINYTTDPRDNYLPTSIQFNAASQPANGSTVTLSRETTINQESDFQDGDPVPQEKFEEGLDKLTLVVQEVAASQDRSLTLQLDSELSSIEFPDPGANEYIKWNAAGDALETGAIDLTTINSSISTLQTVDNSLQAQITSNLAEINTNIADIAQNTLDIASWAGSLSAVETRVTQLEADIDAAEADIILLAGRVSALELVNGLRSSQTILNNQVAGVDLTDFTFDGDVYDYILVDYIINRTTDINYLSEAGTLHLVMRPNKVWTFENGLQVVDIVGVTFSIATLAGNECQLSYTSSDVAGTSYSGKMRYTIKKFEA